MGEGRDISIRNYPFDTTKKRSDFPKKQEHCCQLQKLQIEDVVTDVSPGSADQKQMVAVFKLDDKTYSVPIGSVQAANYQIYSDEIFYIQDPRELYKHWPVETWQAIENHEVKPGMNELRGRFCDWDGCAAVLDG